MGLLDLAIALVLMYLILVGWEIHWISKYKRTNPIFFNSRVVLMILFAITMALMGNIILAVAMLITIIYIDIRLRNTTRSKR